MNKSSAESLLTQMSSKELKAEIAERAKAKRLLLRPQATKSFKAFVNYTDPDYQFNWFNENICDRLDKFLGNVAARNRPRLMIFAPPRHGKSELVSRKFPAYVFGRMPQAQYIGSSYGADLAESMSIDIQRVMDSERYLELFPASRLSLPGDRNSRRRADMFDIPESEGAYRAAGVGGGITGLGGDILSIDDPVKDEQTALSQTSRDFTWDWYRKVLYTRKAPGAGILLIMTRWHMDDLAGRLLAAQETGGEQWEVVSYPAIAEQDSPYRVRGAPLHPERFSLEELEATRGTMGDNGFSALYQQNPLPREGGMFKRRWFGEPVPVAPISVQCVRGWDFAATVGGGDYTVGVKMSVDQNGIYYIEQVERFRGTSHEVEQAVKNLAGFEGKRVTIRIPQDPGQSGKAQAANYAKLLAGWDLRVERETGSKQVRAMPFASQCQAGNVRLVKGNWNEPFLEELENFPNGFNDDQVDAAAGAFETLTSAPRMVISPKALLRAGVNPYLRRVGQ